ncbi:MAG: DNA methyltransferase [Chloroflexi bacterium]|nr:DNA methyltransferase [Chloroflexota bacterium]
MAGGVAGHRRGAGGVGDDMAAFLCFMGIWLIEMRRVLRDDGSLYLHCDPTASHYLKALLDAVFGWRNFRSDIIRRRALAKGLAFKGFPNNADHLLYYSGSDSFSWNRPFLPHDPEYVKRSYRHVEAKTGRRYRLDNLANPNKD